MRLTRRLLACVAWLVVSAAWADAGEAAAAPAIRNPKRHEGFLNDIKQMGGNIDLVFVGDSITDGWRAAGKKTWDTHVAPLKALNLGIGGDCTHHVLTRLQNGELDGYQAKLFVLMIGTNNREDAKTVADGIQAILKEIRAKQAKARILLLGIFPRGEKPNDRRTRNEQANALIAKFDDGKAVKYLDIGDRFLANDKATLLKDLMPDALHPNAKGYEVWGEAIIGSVKDMLAGK
jgi:lysophospholipase L1-like esterase